MNGATCLAASRERRSVVSGFLVALFFLLGPAVAPGMSAQQGPVTDSVPTSPDLGVAAAPFGQEAQEEIVTPRGAFLRSLLVPGWGHIATESYGRGGVYVAAQTGSLWMLWQTLTRRAEATAFLELERELASARLQAGGIADPDSLSLAADSDPAVQDREALVEARSQQVEDWSAISIFLVLLGATDAFVAAHLADYPEPLTFQVLPLGAGRTELRFSVPLSHLPTSLLWRR